MEGWVGLVVDSLPTKWSSVNHRLDAGQGKVYRPETDVLATDLRRQHVSCLLCVVRPAQECQKIFKAQLSMDHDVGRTKVCQHSLEKFFRSAVCVYFVLCSTPVLGLYFSEMYLPSISCLRPCVSVAWVIRALDLRLEIAGSITAAALSSATLDKLFTHICLCHQAV